MKIAFFTIADANNLKYYELLRRSFEKFHPDIPLLLYGPTEIAKYKDPNFYYRAKPTIMNELMEKYDLVVGMDADQIITGPLDELWKTDVEYDAAVVLNSNPREVLKYPVGVWDIPPQEYMNAGFVAVRSKRFIKHWLALATSHHFDAYQFREQDLLNILCHYGDYKIALLDAGDSFWGLASKGYWPQIELRGDELVLPQQKDGWPINGERIIRVIHWAGGNDPQKMKFGLHFKDDVAERLLWLTK